MFISYLHPDHAAPVALDALANVRVEGSYMRKGGLVRADPTTGRPFGHAGIPDLVEFFRRRAPHIVITHFGSWFYKNVHDGVRRIEALGDGVRVSAAHDGLVIEV